ncbi:MAG: ribonuclease III, partial [Acidimicrobiia bacterium]|nr:ribonuclease III [Acidimicrobiia bacterium]MDX2468171.1 ribonuclease III [Acidimicrobiia bacterium]
SYAAEHTLDVSYERLEFLGDAVLQLAVTRHLYDTYEDLAEGELAKVRAAVVNQKALATVARQLGIGDFMLLGQGEERSGGRDKDSILADVVEALLGAIYLDGGYEPAADLVLRLLVPLIGERAIAPGRLDFKTRLQEELAQRGQEPKYVITESGPDHAKSFVAELWVDGEVIGCGEGSSKKRAEQAAASNAAAAMFES